MSAIGRATIRFDADDSELGAAAGRVRKTLDGMRDRMEGVSRMARNMLLIGGGAFAGFIKAASDAQEQASKFEQVFGDQADAAEEFAVRLGEAIGRSTRDLQGALSTFQSFFVGMGFGGGEARKLSERMTELAADFASFHNMSDDEAVERFISALSGSSEVLDRFGVNIKQAALDQELLRQGIEGGASSATEAEKAMARLNVIAGAMGEQGAIGDAERTAGSLANQMKALRGEAIDVATAIGQTVLPAVTKLLKEVREIVPVVQAWLKENGDLIPTITAWTAATLGVLFVLPKVVAAVAATKAAAVGLTTAVGALNIGMAAVLAKFAVIAAGVGVVAALGVIIARMTLMGESFGEAGLAVLRFLDMFSGGALFSALDSLGLIEKKVLELKGELQGVNDAMADVAAAERVLGEARDKGDRQAEIRALRELRDAQQALIAAEKAERRGKVEAGQHVVSDQGFERIQAQRRDELRQTEQALRDLQGQANQSGGEMAAAFQRGEMSADDLRAALERAAEASGQFVGSDDPRARVEDEAQQLIDAEREAALRAQQSKELTEDERVRLVEASSQRIVQIRQEEAERLKEIAEQEAEDERKAREEAAEGLRRARMFTATDSERARMQIARQARDIEQELIDAFREGLITREQLAEEHAQVEAAAQRQLQEQRDEGRRSGQVEFVGIERMLAGVQKQLFQGTVDSEQEIARVAKRQFEEQRQGNRLLGRIEGVLSRIEARDAGGSFSVFGGT